MRPGAGGSAPSGPPVAESSRTAESPPRQPVLPVADSALTSAPPAAWRQPPRGYWRDAFRRLARRPMPMAGLVILITLVLLAAIGPNVSPFSYEEQDLFSTNQPPSSVHWFGTDDLGRDIFVRAWIGARISLFIGTTAALLYFVIGMIYGGIAGYYGGRVDEVMMRVVDTLYGVPHLLVTIMLTVVLQPGLFSIILAMVATGWVGAARLVRGQVLQLREMEYVQATRALGGQFPRILGRHLLPNAMGPLIVAATLSVPSAIFTEATLSFLGLGVPAPLSSWGTMVSDGVVTMFTGQVWRLLVPSVLISLTMFSFNALGDGLRDALDPRTRQ
ncbi:MAG: ABC transporter permease [Chloroflexi bacterium]|nr:ABC transporter permease [Chloroflexota bacterium]